MQERCSDPSASKRRHVLTWQLFPMPHFTLAVGWRGPQTRVTSQGWRLQHRLSLLCTGLRVSNSFALPLKEKPPLNSAGPAKR